MQQITFGARVALESSWGAEFDFADPSNIEGSSRIRSLDPSQNRNKSSSGACKWFK